MFAKAGGATVLEERRGSDPAFGVLGSLIAVPTAVVIMVLIEELWFRRVEEAASDHPRDAGSHHPNILRSREP
jgi:hypothetical protein